jgi:arginyl-tRNA synthetase
MSEQQRISMGIEEQVGIEVERALAELAAAGELPEAVTGASFKVERPKRPEHGDMATNVALAVQKLAKMPPREIAALVAAKLREAPSVSDVDIAGPGFINLRLSPQSFQRILCDVIERGASYGRAPAATRDRVMIEFVSANPTGPLLISHGRGAIVGDGIASLLEAAGYRVSREYYINDFGNQVRLFAASVRALAAGGSGEVPEGGYGGSYVKELSAWLTAHEADALASDDEEALGRLCVTRMLDGVPGSGDLGGIKNTLAGLGIHFDSWFSEDSLHRWGRVSAALGVLQERGALEKRDEALFFKSSDYGDDKDRVVKKSDGGHTYFASDIAYHADKFARGYDHMIVILGADHHGYEARVRGAIKALGLDDGMFEVIFFQLVSLLRDGKPYKMGKRLGNLITIDEIVDEIDEAAQRKGAGADALRYFYLSRRSDNSIDIDIELAKKASLDNPVFYLQMGYARLCSIQRRARDVFELDTPPLIDDLVARVEHADELAILAQLGRFPTVVADAAEAREPHRVVFYLQELSQAFQSYFTRLKNEGDAILPLNSTMREEGWEERWDRDKTRGRLLWIEAIRRVYGAGLRILGITALSRMEPLQPKSDDKTDDRNEPSEE